MENSFDANSFATTNEFYKQMKTYFRPYMISSGAFKWEAVLDFIKHNKTELLYDWRKKFVNTRNLQLFHKFFLQLLDDFECHDASLLEKLVNLYEDLELYPNKERDYHLSMSKEIYDKSREQFKGDPIGRILRHLSHTNINFDLCPAVDFDRVVEAITWGNITLMRVLVKNGFSYQPPKNCFKDYLLERFYYNGSGASVGLGERQFHVAYRCRMFRDTLLKTPCEDLFIRAPQRPALIHMAIKPLLVRPKFCCVPCKYAECFRLFYRTIPEPYLTLQEMEEFLNVYIQRGDSVGVVRKTVEKLKVLFPESDTQYEPRSLLHLCRVKMRVMALEDGKTVPGALSQLKIPLSMKEFILADSE